MLDLLCNPKEKEMTPNDAEIGKEFAHNLFTSGWAVIQALHQKVIRPARHEC
jgi:hypothetical protein